MLFFEGLNNKQWTQVTFSIYSNITKSINEIENEGDVEHCKGLVEWYKKNIVISSYILEETLLNRCENIVCR